MFEQEIDRQLLPNIKLNRSNKYFRYEGKATPLEQAFNFIGKDKSLYLCASGGIGKTTSLRTLWLDFLAGKHDIPCLYVDLKLLGADKGNRAIWDYINDKNKYNLNLDNIDNDSIKPVLLLDAANEAPYLLLETENNKDCFLLQECKTLINDGFRLLISSRAPFIVKEGEFSADMEYCELCGLTEAQRKIVVKDESIYNTPLWDLLQNNIMLSMYLHSESWDIETDKDITAYGLLNHYFEKCFKARYIEATVTLKKEQKVNLYKIIVDIENLRKSGVRFQKPKKTINEKLLEYEEIKEYLSRQGSRSGFCESEVHNNTDLSALAHLGILQKATNDDGSSESNRYVWGHEIYQEYFESIYLANRIKEVSNNKFSCKKVRTVCDLLGDFRHSEHDYRVLQYVAEQGKFNKEDIDNLYNFVLMNDFDKPNEHIRVWKTKDRILRAITLLCYFSAEGFPDKQTSVLPTLFQGYTALKIIEIPDNFTTIGYNAFSGCTALESAKLPNTIEQIGGGAFENCSSLKNINLPGKIWSIYNRAFLGCVKLKNVVLPESLRVLGDRAFSQCCSLEEICIPKKINDSGIGVFSGCSSLKKVFMPHILQGSVIVNNSFFSDCVELEEIELPENIIAINNNAFLNCRALRRVKLPNQVITIDDFAFLGCKSLKYIDLPERLKHIGVAAFAGCPIKNIVLPKNVRSIECNAFSFSFQRENRWEHVDAFDEFSTDGEVSYVHTEDDMFGAGLVKLPYVTAAPPIYFKKEGAAKHVENNVLPQGDGEVNDNVLEKVEFIDRNGWVIVPGNSFYYYRWEQNSRKFILYCYEPPHRRYNEKTGECFNEKGERYNKDDFKPKREVQIFKVPSEMLANPQAAAKLVAHKYCNYQWIKLE